MSTYVDFKVNCPCGYQGVIHLLEGDPPGKLWENYILEGLKRDSLFSESPVNIKDVLKGTKATCPECKKIIQREGVGNTVLA